MEKEYRKKTARNFLLLGICGIPIAFFSFKVGLFVAAFGFGIAIAFGFNLAAEKQEDRLSETRVLPKLKEIESISVSVPNSHTFRVSDSGVKNAKILLKRVQSITSKEPAAKIYEIQFIDKWDGLWDIKMVETENGNFEFVSNQSYFGGAVMKELSKVILEKV